VAASRLWGTGHAVGMLWPYINVAIINIFLEQFAQEIPPEVHAVMVWDQAGFHTGKELKVPESITLVPSPPYSPELNPMENLWHFLRAYISDRGGHVDGIFLDLSWLGRTAFVFCPRPIR